MEVMKKKKGKKESEGKLRRKKIRGKVEKDFGEAVPSRPYLS